MEAENVSRGRVWTRCASLREDLTWPWIPLAPWKPSDTNLFCLYLQTPPSPNSFTFCCFFSFKIWYFFDPQGYLLNWNISKKNWNPASIKTFIKSCCSWLWQCFLFVYSVSTLSLAEVANYENPTHVVCRCCLTLPSLSLIDSYSITSCCLTSCCCCCCCYPSPPQYIGYNICVVAFSFLFYSVIIWSYSYSNWSVVSA